MSIRIKIASAAGLAVSSVVLLTTPAAAHISPSVHSAPAGSYLTFSLQVPHGCGEGATDKLEVQIPEGITSVTPGVVPGWTITRTLAALTTPLGDDEGEAASERTSAITWEGGPLPHDQLLLFPVSVKLPAAGDHVRFPTIQSCDNGEQSEWIQPFVEGEAEPDHPAPTIELTAASGDGHGASTTVTLRTDDDPDDGDDGDSGSTPLAAAGVALGAAGLVVGGLALKRSGGRS